MSLEVQTRLLPHLVGKLHLYQDWEEQRRTIVEALEREPEFAGMTPAERQLAAAEFLALDVIEPFVRDPRTEDVMINATKSIFIYNAEHGMMRTEKRFASHAELEFFVRKLVVLAGKSEVRPSLDLHLPRNLRVNYVVGAFGPQITIRKMKSTPPSILDLLDWGMLDVKTAADLWLYADGLGIKPANILVGGAPGSGKSTLLNALFSFFPANERIVTIEDTIELNTESEENCARLEVNDDLDANALVKNALRMRPDRVVVGEVRGVEARSLITAMNIGKICMGTIHANSARNIITRLSNDPMNISQDVLTLIDVLIIVKSFPDEGRVHRAVVEIVETAGRESQILLTAPQHYDLKHKRLEHSEPRTIYRDKLARLSDKRAVDILKELDTRARILMALRQRGLRSIPEISAFAKEYYVNPEAALAKIGLRR
ncbi:MAG: Flp pilus assembly complex ATPase component TadA [Candidatus Methylomirabilis sp.]|nr:Flp pilus assembly complex ATPase component TadA [Deltaproteobacteria bacterium]